MHAHMRIRKYVTGGAQRMQQINGTIIIYEEMSPTSPDIQSVPCCKKSPNSRLKTKLVWFLLIFISERKQKHSILFIATPEFRISPHQAKQQ